MDDARYTKYATWREEAARQCRDAVLPPVGSRLPPTIDVAAIRFRLGHEFAGKPLTQKVFAHRYGFSLAAVRDWEGGRRKPNAAARAFLLLIADQPSVVDTALQAAINRDQPPGPVQAPA